MFTRRNMRGRIARLRPILPQLLLACLVASYIVYFCWYTINRHNTLNSYMADLSLIDQPMWNTVIGPGGFMEVTWGDRQQPRLAEHFEPILVPLALLFFIWDDVRVLLIAQSVALALGALPVFWIARDQLTIKNEPLTNPNLPFTNWAALAFAAAYLLYPHLQAANIADFHADPFVVAPLLFAFWYASQRRWKWMWLWAIIAMLTKENLPTLTAMLGLFIIIDAYRHRSLRQLPIVHGLALILLSAAWFFVATFLIVAPLARHYFGTDGPIYLANRFNGGPAALPALLADPARWRYLLGLLAAAGFLPLLAPELLILGLPVLLANFFSNFPGQYSGEQHYSAPLVAAFIVAAIYGTRRLINRLSLRENNGWPLRKIALIAACLWLLGWSLGYHSLRGWTPLSIRAEHYQMTPAAAQLPALLRHIPAEAVTSASAGVHPHLAHRQVAYTFPIVQEAGYLLVDVTDIPGVHPFDARAQVIEMLTTDWSILQATDGLILAQKSPADPSAPPPPCSPAPLPCPFYQFARSISAPATLTHLAFGDGRLRLLGYDVLDDPDDGLTFRFYWQAAQPLPAELQLWPLVFDDLGRLLSDPTQAPMIAAVWYPPNAWQPGEMIVTETLPQLLPRNFHLGLAVGANFADPSQRWPATGQPGERSRLQPGGWVQLASFTRQGHFLTLLPPLPGLQPITPAETQFGPDIQLTGYRLDPPPARAGNHLGIRLQWQAGQPPPRDFTVFVHLLAADGARVAQSDAYPTWLFPQPTSQWPLHQPVVDVHTLALPADLPPGQYTLRVGLYDAQTLQRLARPDGSDYVQLGQVHIE